jgi:Ca2+-binding RTX toxin-like protein
VARAAQPVHPAVLPLAPEPLERRRLLSSGALAGGVWTITGDAVADTLTITVNGSNLEAKDGGVLVTGDGSVLATSVNTIVVNAGDGGDTVTNSTSKPSTLNGENGSDALNGGTGDDTLEGGAGNDTLAGGTGNDTYKFSGSGDLGSDSITENPIVPGPDASVDVFDFTGLGEGIRSDTWTRGNGLDISLTTTQDVALDPSTSAVLLQLTLSSGTGIENVLGTPYVDNITGNGRNNRLEGRDSTDMLYAADGNDTVDGGNGDADCVHGEEGNDVEYGGAGDFDSVGHDSFGSGGHDDSGNDTIYGGSGDDRNGGGGGGLGGDSGADVIYGDAGNDEISGGSENDVIYGGTGQDTAWAGSGADLVFGESSSTGSANGGITYNDSLMGESEADTLYGNEGNDYVDGGSENDRVYGDFATVTNNSLNEGDDTLVGAAGNDTLQGDSGNITYGYGYGNDSLDGGDGMDSLVGDGGQGFLANNTVGSSTYGYGIFGQDTLEGGAGDDTLKGENDADVYVFETSSSTDTLGTDQVVEDHPTLSSTNPASDFGRDVLDFTNLVPSTAGATVNISLTTTQVVTTGQLSLLLTSSTGIEDVIGSAAGNDNITGNSLGNILRGLAGDDTLDGGTSNDTVYGGDGNDTIFAGTGDDKAYGDVGNDLMYGNDGNDLLYGGDNSDTIYGGNHNDTLWGDDAALLTPGSDALYGEAGNDLFRTNDGGVMDILSGGIGTDTASLASGHRDSSDLNPLGDIENWA